MPVDVLDFLNFTHDQLRQYTERKKDQILPKDLVFFVC